MTRGGVVRQLIVEHVMLAVAGASAGLVLAAWLTHGLVALAPLELPRLDTIQVDWRGAAFALGAGFVTLIAFGLAPALSLARTHAGEMLAEGGRAASSTGYSTQRTVVAAEIAMSAVLVVGAGLLGETLFRLTSQRLGFDPSTSERGDNRTPTVEHRSPNEWWRSDAPARRPSSSDCRRCPASSMLPG